MSGVGLKRALTHFVEEKIPEARCYADETANELRRYPCFYLVDIDEKRAPLGCGRVDYVARNSRRHVSRNGKIFAYQTTIRFQAEAASDESRPGAEIVLDLTKRLDLLFLEAVKARERIVFADPVSGEPQEIVGIHLVTAADVPPDTEQEPVVYRRAATFRFTHCYHREEPVDRTIERIHLRDLGGNDV